jgi:NADPH:quinone reductase-like Zn-dependent oxidoreductase
MVDGDADAVGLDAAQSAHRRGDYAIATASADNHDVVQQLGADGVIDYAVLNWKRT